MSKVLFLTKDTHLSEQLPQVFAELELEIESTSNPEDSFPQRVGSEWQAVILDLETFASPEHAGRCLQLLPNPKVTALLLPTRLRHLEATARLTGALVLHKPSTVGEIGLALRILLKRWPTTR